MGIYLSSVIGSRDLETSAIANAIMAMAIRLTQVRNTLKNHGGVSIDLTMMLPGKSQRPDFEGMRMTRYASDEARLYIESVVPEQMLHSEQADRYVSALVQDALENADEFFTEHGLRFDAAEWQSVLQKSEE